MEWGGNLIPTGLQNTTYRGERERSEKIGMKDCKVALGMEICHREVKNRGK